MFLHFCKIGKLTVATNKTGEFVKAMFNEYK